MSGIEESRTLEVCTHDEPGFRPVVCFENWRIALSNADRDENINEMSRHLLTDESFVLLEGECVLLTAADEEELKTPRAVFMKKCVVYNVPKGVWHAHLMKRGTRLLIVENADTGLHNSDRVFLTPEQNAEYKEIARSAE